MFTGYKSQEKEKEKKKERKKGKERKKERRKEMFPLCISSRRGMTRRS